MNTVRITGFLKGLYSVCAALLLAAIVFNAVVTGAIARGMYGFVATVFVLYFSYYLVFLRHQVDGWIDILKPVFFSIS